VTPVSDDKSEQVSEDTSANVVDFMALLEKSLASNKRTPAQKRGASAKPAAKKATKKASPAKKAAKKVTRKVVRKAG